MCMLKCPYLIFLEIKNVCNTFLFVIRTIFVKGSMKYWLNEKCTLIKNEQPACDWNLITFDR